MRKVKLKVLEEVNSLLKENVGKARKLAMRHNLRLPVELRRKFCHKCNSLFNSKNTRIRVSKGKLVITCLKCSHITRIHLKGKKE